MISITREKQSNRAFECNYLDAIIVLTEHENTLKNIDAIICLTKKNRDIFRKKPLTLISLFLKFSTQVLNNCGYAHLIG